MTAMRPDADDPAHGSPLNARPQWRKALLVSRQTLTVQFSCRCFD